MFDISFAELMMIAIVALIVIGPDKLPQVAKTVGAYVGRLQRYVAQVKEEVNREVRFEELKNLQQEIKMGVDKVESSIIDSANKIEQELAVKDTLNTAARSISEKKANAKPLKSSTSKPSSKSNTNSTTAKKPVKKQKMHKA